MAKSRTYTEKRAAIAGWLLDYIGDDEAVEPLFWRPAADLLRYMHAQEWEVLRREDLEKMRQELNELRASRSAKRRARRRRRREAERALGVGA